MSDHDTRKLTADELYPFLYRDYRRAQVRIGELESYIDELKYENQNLKHQLNQTQNELKETSDPEKAPHNSQEIA